MQDYSYLLKGHEDLRQDERVMQVRKFERTAARILLLTRE